LPVQIKILSERTDPWLETSSFFNARGRGDKRENVRADAVEKPSRHTRRQTDDPVGSGTSYRHICLLKKGDAFFCSAQHRRYRLKLLEKVKKILYHYSLMKNTGRGRGMTSGRDALWKT